MYLDNESHDTSDAYLADGRAGHRIRVNVELVRARDGVQLWADAYDQTDADLLAIEETIARSVATAIAGRLLPLEQATIAARPTQSPEAYDHFLRGNFLMAQRAPAAAADRALQLDSLSTDAWLARAYTQVYLHPSTFGAALPAFERAIALDPKNAEAHHQYGGILMCMGRDSAAAAEFERALALEPLRGITLDNLADLRYLERRTAEALRFADSGIAADPQAYYLYVDRGNIRLTAGDVAGARADAEAAARTHPADYAISSEALSATVQAYAGDTAGARSRLERAEQQLADPAHPDYTQAQWLALAWLRIGDRQRALAVLEAVRPRGIDLWYVMRDPGFDPIRQDPRFRALDEEIRPARSQ
jgi:adenylate cyclase